ncbi:MAG: fibronectin type III domain-containing protein [Candidatus Nanopelagicales bacterium]
MQHFVRRTRAAGIGLTALGVSALLGLGSIGPAAAAQTAGVAATSVSAKVPGRPAKLHAVRDSVDPTRILIDWTAVSGATRYNVSIMSSASDDVETVTGTTYTVTGTDPTKTYRIQVSSRNDAGEGTSTGVFYLRPAPTPAIKGLVAKYSDAGEVLVSWKTPTGHVPTGYLLQVIRSSDKQVVFETKVAADATSAVVPSLPAGKVYTVTLRSLGASGEGPVAKVAVSDPRAPEPVTAVGAIRDPGAPSKVKVSWVAPASGAAITGYEIGYGPSVPKHRKVVKSLPAVIEIAKGQKAVVTVRTLTDTAKSGWTKPVEVPADNDEDTTTTSTKVDLIEQGGVVSVSAAKALCRDFRLSIHIAPTGDNGGFTDTQYAQQDACLLTFRTVPSGSYLVVVNANGSEVARRYLTIGSVGRVAANAWIVTAGKADLLDGGVDMPYGNESRAFLTEQVSTQDFVFIADAQLRNGQGYGVFFRASQQLAGQKINGLSVQYDPGWGNKFIIRHWNNGAECSAPIAATPFPSSLKVNDAHQLVVAGKGDSLYVTIDGIRLFDVPSLAAAMAGTQCGYTAPTGTAIGVRTWGATSTVFRNVTVNH